MLAWWKKQNRIRKFLIIWNSINAPIVMGVLFYAAAKAMIPLSWVGIIAVAAIIGFGIVWKLTENKIE